MELAELIKSGWEEHEHETEKVARDLEAGIELVLPDDPSGAAAFMNLVGHTIGDHGGDRPRALRLCESVVERLADLGNREPILHLAVARHLAGEEEAARAAERELGADAVSQVRVRLLVAQGLVHGEAWGKAIELYTECIAVADSLPTGHGAERAAALVSNNISSALLHIEERDDDQSQLMERAAHTAHTYWLRVGDWTNSERADYLLAMVYNSLERGAEAREFARRGLQTIATNGEAKVDQAFLELALAKACKLRGDFDEQSLSILRATALADEFGDEGLSNWFNDELKKAR